MERRLRRQIGQNLIGSGDSDASWVDDWCGTDGYQDGIILPSVSVIIAAFNAELHLRESVASILAQDYKGRVEVLVCDDCSTDGTSAVIQELVLGDPRVVALRTARNSGSAAARNVGLQAATGDYVAVQDADDISDARRLSTLVGVLEQNSTVDFVSSWSAEFDDRGVHTVRRFRSAAPTRWSFLYGLPFLHAGTVFRAAALTQVGGYRVAPETRRSEDYDLFMRLYARGFRGITVPQALYQYRVDQNTFSRRTLAARLDEMVVRWKGFRSLGVLPWAAPFVLKPIPAHLASLRRAKTIERRRNQEGIDRNCGS